MEKYGVVDIGSNTVRLEVYKVGEEYLQLFFKKKINLGLSSYVEDGVISEKGIQRLITTLDDFKTISDNLLVKDLFVFATAAIRNSVNSKQVINKIRKDLGLEVDLITGEMEAELGYKAVTSSFGIDSGLNIDIGGGSSEITVFNDGEFKVSKSFTEGSLSMFRKHVNGIIPTKKEAKKIRREVRDFIETEKISKEEWKKITGVGGTIRMLGKLVREYYDKNNKTKINLKKLKPIIRDLMNGEKETTRMLLQIAPDRIHTAVPGALILMEFCKYFSVRKLLVSDSGVRTGYLMQKLNN